MSSDQSKRKGLIFVISGPSGSGKTTLAEKIARAPGLRGRIVKSLSFTTRPRRSGEVSGRQYLFVSERQFLRAVKAKKILERTRYLGYYYGTSRVYLEAQRKKGRHLIMCLDGSGVREIKSLYPRDTVTVFVLPPSLSALRLRIRRRCAHTCKKEIRHRLSLARQELAIAKSYDFQLVNDKLETVFRKLREIIVERINLRSGPKIR